MRDIERELRELGLRTTERLRVQSTPVEQVVRRARLHRTGAALGALGLVVSVVAGGYAGVRAFRDGKSTVLDRSVLVAAVQATEREGSARVEFEMSMTAEASKSTNEEPLVMDFTVHGSGVVDFKARRSHMRMGMGGASSPRKATEMIQDGKRIFHRELSGDWSDEWITLGLPGSPGLMGGLPAQQTNPSDYLTFLESISNDIEELGQERLDDVDVTHYRAIIDADRALGTIWNDTRAIGTGRASFAPAEAWVDAEGLVRKFTYGAVLPMDLGLDDSGAPKFAFKMDLSVRLYDFGVPVDIELPDPKDVTKGPVNMTESNGPSPTDGNDGFIDPFGGLLIMGEKGDHGPTLSILGSEGPVGVCLFGTGNWVTGAEVRNVTTDEVIAELSGGDPDELSLPDGLQLTCFPERFPRDLVDSLADHPMDYVLRLKGGSRTEDIELTTARRPRSPND